jgi:hypothetical protein
MRRLVVATALAVSVAFHGIAQADTFSITPSLELTERYDSNVTNARPGGESSDFVTRATPKLTGVVSILETKVSVDGGFDAEYFGRHSELNRNRMTNNLNLTSADPLALAPGIFVRPTARYVESRDSVRRNELSQAASAGNTPADSQVAGRTGTRDYSGSLEGTFALSPLVNVGLTAGAGRRSYFDAPPSFIGSNNYSAEGNLLYQVSPNTSSGFYAVARYDEFDNKNDVRNFSGGITGKHRFSESTSLDGRLGATWIRTDMTSDRIVRPSGRLKLSHVASAFVGSLGGSIDYVSGSFGNETKREAVNARLSRRFSTDWEGDAAGNWQSTRSLQAPFIEDLSSTQWTATVRYAVTRYARLRLSAELFRQWNQGLTGSDLYRESVVVGIDLGSTIPVF